MRKVSGVTRFDANVTTTENALATALMIKPEISMHIVNLFEGNFTSFSSYLSRKGMVKKGTIGQVDNDFRVLSNRRFQWAVKGYPLRMGKIMTTVSGSNIGQNQAIVEIVLDTNYFSPNDVLELKDNRTLVHVLGMPEETTDGNFKYKVKLVTNLSSASIASDLLTQGSEIGFSYTEFPEMSETGYEKNSYPEWFTETMTIQRMQYSISGTAGNSSVAWVEHNGQKLWYYTQEEDMMLRWAIARENQLLFGRSTSDSDGNVLLKDIKGEQIVAGNGLLAQGEASLKFQYNTLSVRVLDNILQNLQIMADGTGEQEVMLIGGQQLVWNFQRLMASKFTQTGGNALIDGSGSDKGYNPSFAHYRVGGVKLTVAWCKAFDFQAKPSDRDVYGNRTSSSRGVFISLGNTVGGGANVELVTLGAGGQDRRFVKKEIDGMFSIGNSSSGRASTSMDGTQVQVLSETGLKLSNPYGIAEIYM